MSTTLPAVALAAAVTLAALWPAQDAQAADAMRVVRDPATGELRAPNAAEAAAFEKAEAQLRSRSGKKPQQPVEILYPDGTIEMKLGDDTHMVSVVRASEDGTLAMACLPAKQAQDFVKSAGSKKAAPKSFAAKPGVKQGASHE